MLAVTGLGKNFGERVVLQDVSFQIAKGEVVVVIGPSGCGKSTLLRCLNGLEKADAGQVRLDGQDLCQGQIKWSLVRQRIGMVFQSYDLFPHLTVKENLLLGPLRAQRRRRVEALAQAEELLDRVGLLDRAESYPRQLSGGQKQRVAIIRALCMNPEIILFDEVTAALDPEMVAEVLEVMLGLAQQGMTMLIVTHEMDFARGVADRVIFLDAGVVVEESPPDIFFTAAKSERVRRFLDRRRYERRLKTVG
ncbi:MAG: amino acid ABC transporter ATP-binding protein [Planctomycetota bacterium]|nr:amino acid ABC transporter ATP-binding protein [Planctomycetota bacterium]